MLKIQEFINSHNNWKELLTEAPYFLRISKEDGYILFKYNQIKSDFNERICQEARGLILDSTNNFNPVRLAFYKFFNLGESFAAVLDWNSGIATEKQDGSLISVWYGRSGWKISTNGTIDAYKADLGGLYKNFGDLFEVVAKNSNLELSKLNPNYCYTFELCSKFNKVVLDYGEPILYHISTRNMKTLEEIEVDIGVQKPQSYILSSQEDYQRLVAAMDDTHEGIVVKDKYYNRVKIKTESYFRLHKMINNGVLSLENVVDLIRSNDYEEFLCYFNEYREYFMRIKKKFDTIPTIITSIQSFTNNWKAEKTSEDSKQMRRWFAQDIPDSKLRPFYFKAYDEQLQNFVDNLTTKQLIKFFELEEEK